VADIKMIKYHELPIAKAKEVVKQAADDLGAEYDLQSEWHGNTLRFQRSGVNGEMRVSASEIDLEVTLGFLLKPFKAKFVQAIEHNFERLLAKPAKSSSKAAKTTARKAPSKQAARKR
jgi:putative polyhydroxyalkanoate system protein